MIEAYKKIYLAIDKVCQGFSNLCFIQGPGGIGKSFHIKKAFERNNIEPVEVNGDVSEAYLYRLLYENNGKPIWFREVVKLFSNMRSINLLKSATETESERIICSNNYSNKESDLPRYFLCKSSFVFDYNCHEVMSKRFMLDFEALLTRGDHVVVALSDDDIKSVMYEIARTQNEKVVTDFIINNYDPNSMPRLNLRTQIKAFNTFEYAIKNGLDWKSLVLSELNTVTMDWAMVYSVIGKNKVKTNTLKKLLIKRGIVNSKRSADRYVNELLFIGTLRKVGSLDRNFLVELA